MWHDLFTTISRNDIKPAGYCWFLYNHFKSNDMVWYTCKNISLIFTIIQRIFIRSRKRIKQDFFFKFGHLWTRFPCTSHIYYHGLIIKLQSGFLSILTTLCPNYIFSISKHIHLRYTTSTLYFQVIHLLTIYSPVFHIYWGCQCIRFKRALVVQIYLLVLTNIGKWRICLLNFYLFDSVRMFYLKTTFVT